MISLRNHTRTTGIENHGWRDGTNLVGGLKLGDECNQSELKRGGSATNTDGLVCVQRNPDDNWDGDRDDD